MGGLAFRRIRPLLEDDDVSGFCSGNSDNDTRLKEWARRAMRDGAARVYVLPLSTGEICGFYALSTHAVARVGTLAGSLRRNAPNPIPCTLLGQLAVDKRYQGKTAGARLLQDAILRAAAASRIAASRALVVDPADECAEGFYAHFGFQRLASDSRRMFVRL